MNRKPAFVYAPAMEGMSYPADCPFKTHRVGLTRQRLRSLGLLGGGAGPEVAADPARATDLEAFHEPEYLQVLQEAAGGSLTFEGLHRGLGQPDTPVFKDMFNYGALACGASLAAADRLLSGEADVAFNLAGGFHHARAGGAAGFCYLNDGVLACLRLTRSGHRVAYLDIDAHHGDGVQEAFYDRSEVLTVSLHESGRTLYPGGGWSDELGRGDGLGYNVNLPLPAGTYDEAYLGAFRSLVPPLFEAFRPGVLVLELGMDALAGDPLTHLGLTNNAHLEVVRWLLGLRKPLLVLGGGGYHVENTVRGWALAWSACCEDDPIDDLGLPLGGVLLSTTEWTGGLKDRVRPVSAAERERIEPGLLAEARILAARVLQLQRCRGDSGRGASSP